MPEVPSGPKEEHANPGTPGRPVFRDSDARELVSSFYGIAVRSASPLPSDRDQNFLIEAASEGDAGVRYVLKIANADHPAALLHAELTAMKAAAAAGLPVPRIVPTGHGEDLISAQNSDRKHLVRLLTYLEGRPLAQARPQSVQLLTTLGRMLGTLDAALLKADISGADRTLIWDPIHAASTISEHIDKISDRDRRRRVQHLLTLFEAEIPSLKKDLPRQVIHCDTNDYNVVVQTDAESGTTVSGLLDFGDITRTVRISEIAVACAYAMLDKPDPVGSACAVLTGYHDANPLTETEIKALFPLICGRLGISVCMSAHQKRLEPENAYLTISEAPVWRLITQLSDEHPRLAWYRFRDACGCQPFPDAEGLSAWLLEHAREAADILDFGDGGRHRARVFDFSVGSTAWTPDVLTDRGLGEERVFQILTDQGASVGVGRYDEPRLVYASEQFLCATGERRTVHLGLDLFQPPGSPVFAPFAGSLHSASTSDIPGDYGTALILRHETAEGKSFYTLYGHLSKASLGRLEPGQQVEAGDQIGTLGDRSENGGWVPHLHFQVIGDLLDQQGTFIGVAAPSQRRVWTSLCPNPNVITRFPEELFPPRTKDRRQLLEARRKSIGPSLSLSYREPLHIVRGYLQYLYDAEGRQYLDAVNNVPHVGHSHPYVVGAAQRQMQTLNTNTRYLHELLVEYADRLTETMPDGLRTVYFVNSGSEANDLALRMARAHSGARHTMVIEGAYHGNLSSLIDISPYKYDGKGGQGPPPTTHALPMPDSYRGRHRGPDTGKAYAAYAQKLVQRFADAGESVIFIAESALSCGGQIFLPSGYLASVYESVRSIGGVCIADEVQVGMGRLGSHFWGFERENVVPDIVTIGKPIGNGHPLGAVVTTPEIAASFANGMEYFNSFGGNPVSCAIGLAVLDVLENERLQQQAASVGRHLLSGLRSLQERHAIIGDVRGFGLFLGVELVTSRASLEPASWEAAYVVNRMKEAGVLLSTDGPSNNVIKIKPPLVFTVADADYLLRTLDDVLSEDPMTCRT